MTPEEEEEHLPDPEYCTAIVYRQTRYQPEELCENEVYEGEEFCLWHLPRDDF